MLLPVELIFSPGSIRLVPDFFAKMFAVRVWYLAAGLFCPGCGKRHPGASRPVSEWVFRSAWASFWSHRTSEFRYGDL